MEAVLDDVVGAVFVRYLHGVYACCEYKGTLARGPRPVVVADRRARVLIIGQAPGCIVYETGTPWNDRSGDRLRQRLQISYDDFCADRHIAVAPIGFCFSGTGTNSDLPPRPECAPRQHRPLLTAMSEVRLALLMDTYTQRSYLDVPYDWTLTDVVRNGPMYDAGGRVLFPLPHPNLHSLAWFKYNPWFDARIVLAPRATLAETLA